MQPRCCSFSDVDARAKLCEGGALSCWNQSKTQMMCALSIIEALLLFLWTPVCKAQTVSGDPIAGAVEQNLLQASYQRAWRLVRDNTMFPEKLPAWNSWRHRFDGKLRDRGSFEEAVSLMISDLGDEYTYFRNSDETQSWQKHEFDSSVVTTSVLSSRTAYISISTFSSSNTANELEAALKQLSGVEAFIIDLRENRGGYVEQALDCFELMTDRGRFISMVGREDGKPYSEVLQLHRDHLERIQNGISTSESRRQNFCGDKPMIILVNENTRSAGEMLAGALRDSRNAKIVGSKTFGKGVVQSSWYLEPGCSLKVAMAKYYLPLGEDIHRKGIMPDYPAEFKTEEKAGQSGGTTKLSQTQLSTLQEYLPRYCARAE